MAAGYSLLVTAPYRADSAEHSGLPDQSVDLIVAAQAAHWFNLPGFYAEAQRISRPSCILALVSYGVPCMAGKIGERLSRFYWEDIHGFWPGEREHVESGYQTLAFPFNDRTLPPLWIERRWSLGDLIGYVNTWSSVDLANRAGHGKLVDQLADDLKLLWGDDSRQLISWPIASRLATLG